MVAATKPTKNRSDNYVEIVPNAHRLLLAIRELGYESAPAVCDLIDNAIDADAKGIDVTVRKTGNSIFVEVVDDGSGMSKERLHEALRLGSDTPKDVREDLGKYGMGLVTASLSFARTIFVVSREKGKSGHEAIFDMDAIAKENRFFMELKLATSAHVNEVGSHGTLVRLSNVDRLDDTNVTRFSDRLRVAIGQTFRNFIGDGLKVRVNRKSVDPIDPLMRDHAMTSVRLNDDIDLGHGVKAHLTIVELPDLGDLDDEHGIAPTRSGFYILRNRREIMGAQTFGMYKHHHAYSHFRAELSFSGELDQAFHVDVRKTSIMPDDQLIERIAHHARRYIEQSGRQGRETAVQKIQLTHSLTHSLLGTRTPSPKNEPGPRFAFDEVDMGSPTELFVAEQENGQLKIRYNKRHPLIEMVAAAKLAKGAAILDMLILAMVQAADKMPGGEKYLAQVVRILNNRLDNRDEPDKRAAKQ